ncbi:MAG TPA: hypothetical protein PLR64_02260 [Candidatus Dojkabacteria bacterium]|nr:hypothetical protein [Candidatus Dojkabacteria bacterium]
MRTYYIIKWEDHGKETSLSREAVDIYDLLCKLQEEFGEEILIHSHNYNYISNFSHALAAGYAHETLQYITIEQAISPAHINKDFFYILGYIENKNEKEL